MRRSIRVPFRGLALGLILGVIGVGLIFLTGGTIKEGSNVSFSIGGAVFGFGLVVWSTSLISGRSLLAAKRRLQPDAKWSLEDLQVAMGTLASIGAGWMVGSIFATVFLQSV
ncbi:MAG: hypothetical protein SV377_05710 [Halobacteria archaeon]|nr:hypothetical protein [Halobacteria archaeon]